MELFHNICAVDLGSWTLKISALTNSHRFEILVNQANFRETPSVVSFTNAQRLIGDQAIIKMKSNFKNTIRAPQRLIGLGKKPHILQQQMKYTTLQYRVDSNTILFQIDTGSQKYDVEPEQVLVALMTKINTIFNDNSIKTDSLYITVQSYLNNGERKVIKSCAQATGFKNVGLIQQWEAIAAEYFFVRQQQIQASHDEMLIIFVDLGYANFCVHACVISKNKMSLLDQQYLRYTGAKNIDNLLLQFYLELVQKQSGVNILNNHKAIIKLQEAIEIQRKKLSANTENQLVIECLVGDYDLSYNMKRQELENIAMPILAQLASAMQNLRSRVQPLAPIHSIELIGGVSRMPFIQQIVRTVFNIQPSKKMNASESIARGCSIAAASRLGMLKANMCNFSRTVKHPIVIFIHVVSTDNKKYGKNPNAYQKCERKLIFDRNSILPANTIVKIEGAGQNQVLVCRQDHMGISPIGYLSFKGPDNLTLLFDNDGILRARLMKQNNFDEYDMGDLLSVEKTTKLRQIQEKMKSRDNNILQSYEIRNQFQSLLYNTKQNLIGKWSQFCPPEETNTILEIINDGQEWLSKSSQHSIQNFKQRIDTITMLTDIINARKAHSQKIQDLKKLFNEHHHTVSKLHPQPQKQAQLGQIQQQFIDLYNKESNSFWDSKYLTEDMIKQMLQEIQKLK